MGPNENAMDTELAVATKANTGKIKVFIGLSSKFHSVHG